MGAFYETIPPNLQTWLLTQKLFWVSTAPLSPHGHVNVSPKGGNYFGLTSPTQFWYQDLTGSGNETISHLLEPGNGRITILFNAFDGPPRIVRLWGKGRVLEFGTREFGEWVEGQGVEVIAGTRSIIVVEVHQVGASCGFSVPYFEFREMRPILNEFMRKKEERFLRGEEKESMDRYWAYKNAWSMDGLPGMKRGLDAGKREKVAPIQKMVGPLAPTRYSHGQGFSAQQVLLIAVVCVLIGMLIPLYGPELVERARKVESGVLRNVITGHS